MSSQLVSEIAADHLLGKCDAETCPVCAELAKELEPKVKSTSYLEQINLGIDEYIQKTGHPPMEMAMHRNVFDKIKSEAWPMTNVIPCNSKQQPLYRKVAIDIID